jgi:hypothetical protein
MYDYAAILFKRRRTLNFFYFYVQLTIHSPGFFTIRFSPLHTRLLLGLYFPLRFFFSFWTQMATTSLSSIHGRTETHQSAFVGEQKKENGREELELQPRSRPFDPSPLCLYTTPDGLPHHHHPGKRRRRRRRTNVSANAHNRHYMACLHLSIETSARRPARPSPTLPRFQSAI